MRLTLITAAAVLALAATGATAVAQQSAAGGSAPAGPARWTLVPMLVESKAFEDGGIVPLKYSFYGANTLPDFKISNLPATTQSIAVILHDLDVAPAFNSDDNLHWLAWNIPATIPVTQIEEGMLPEGAVNGRGRPYMGMGAPNGPRYHHYVFEFYALNAKLDLPATAGRPELLEAMKGKVAAKAAYVGRFRNDTNAVRPGGPGGAGPRGPAPGGAPPTRPTAQ
ncbi:MAG TPA: YbhB/YbcL family Raf kinase inhibitor-like protein [Steroidobacteraceae bacterium]|nr:YbhB/YbcL family Raf kinase inhibitor-like protein [Steroidobacteraceae bacterium]